jgi:hypothetical protein
MGAAKPSRPDLGAAKPSRPDFRNSPPPDYTQVTGFTTSVGDQYSSARKGGWERLLHLISLPAIGFQNSIELYVQFAGNQERHYSFHIVSRNVANIMELTPDMDWSRELEQEESDKFFAAMREL